MEDYQARFNGMERLYGVKGQQKIRNAHICIIGIGGVGSWSAEALARSGVGEITLVDLDDVCVSNTNRQIHTTHNTLGEMKVGAMKNRIQAINPDCIVHELDCFFNQKNAEKILETKYDYIIDAFDSLREKALLLNIARDRKLPLVTVGGAGGRVDPTKLDLKDLSLTRNDTLFQKVRKKLRKDYDFPLDGVEFGIPAVFSYERPVYPTEDGGVSTQCNFKPGQPRNCQIGFGSASFVTGAMGFIAASHALTEITKEN